MISKVIQLFISFLYIGSVSFGGGNAMIPFIQELVEKYGWMDAAGFADMLAISQVTPGPIAINMATYVGYTVAGPIGSFFSTLAVSLPAFTLITLIMRFILKKFQDSPYMKGILHYLRPAVVGLISVAVVNVASIALVNTGESGLGSINILGVCITIGSLIAMLKFKVSPIVCIIIAGIIGVIAM